MPFASSRRQASDWDAIWAEYDARQPAPARVAEKRRHAAPPAPRPVRPQDRKSVV